MKGTCNHYDLTHQFLDGEGRNVEADSCDASFLPEDSRKRRSFTSRAWIGFGFPEDGRRPNETPALMRVERCMRYEAHRDGIASQSKRLDILLALKGRGFLRRSR